MKRLVILALLAVLFSGALSAQTQVDPRVGAAVADLSQRLGIALTIDDFTTWSFAENRYPDSSLGCAAAGGAAAPGSFLAFQVTLVYQGTTFDYRVASDLSRVFPCDAALLAGNPPVLLTASPMPLPAGQATFTPVPQPTNPASTCPSGFAGFLTPRLQVGGQGMIETGGTPNRLRSSPSSTAPQIGTISGGQTFSIIGGPACADGIVWWQVAVGSQVGWTAEGLLPDDYFISPIGGPAPTPVIPAPQTSDTDLAALAAIRDSSTIELFSFDPAEGGLVSVDTITVQTSDTAMLSDLRFAPAGTSIVYTQTDGVPGMGMIVANGFEYLLDRDFPLLVAPDPYTALTITFSPDGNAIVYATLDAQNPSLPSSDPNTALANLIVYERALGLALDGPMNPARLLGRLPFGIGCGGGSPYPGDTAYNREIGYGGRSYRLEVTSYGLLYTANCAGTTTLLADPEAGTSVEVGDGLSQAALSPDGERVAGVSEGGRLQIVTLETLDSVLEDTEDVPSRVAWATDGSGRLYYSTRIVAEPIPVGENQALGSMGFNDGVRAYDTAIYVLDPETGATELIYEGYHYDIGRLLPAPDGTLFFSAIPNGDAWVEAISDGSADIGEDSFDVWLREYFAVELYALGEDGEAVLLGENLNGAALNIAAYGAAG
jgi:hypothetical protein